MYKVHLLIPIGFSRNTFMFGDRIEGTFTGEVRIGDIFGAGGNLNITWRSSSTIGGRPPYRISLF